MRPGARLAAAIDILDTWSKSDSQLESVLGHWARANRYAGSKDRAAIADRVYTVLRRRGECAHAMQADTPRGWVLGSLAVEDGLSAENIAALLASAPHAPPPLTDAERQALARPLAKTGGDVPSWLYGELVRSLGHRLPEELAALRQRAPLDLRVNVLKATREDACEALAGEGIAADMWSGFPTVLRCAPGAPVTKTRTFSDGWVEIQDAGAQIAAAIADPRPGATIIDLAAGAGGKALALAAAMGNRGRIIAADIAPERLARLAPRAERAGVTIIDIHPANTELLDGLSADCVVLDVPCSGSGTWRRHPDQKWRLTPEGLQALRRTQEDLLTQGARHVSPGGSLVYMTCSLLSVENDWPVSAFLRTAPAFRSLPPGQILALPQLSAMTCLRQGIGVSLTPAASGTDGFYVAVLERQALD